MRITQEMVEAVINVARNNMRSISRIEIKQMLEAAVGDLPDPPTDNDFDYQRQLIRGNAIADANKVLAEGGYKLVLTDVGTHCLLENQSGRRLPGAALEPKSHRTGGAGAFSETAKAARLYPDDPQDDARDAHEAVAEDTGERLADVPARHVSINYPKEGSFTQTGIEAIAERVVDEVIGGKRTGVYGTTFEQLIDTLADRRIREFFRGEFTEQIKDVVRDETRERCVEWVPDLVNAEVGPRIANEVGPRLDRIEMALMALAALHSTTVRLMVDKILQKERG